MSTRENIRLIETSWPAVTDLNLRRVVLRHLVIRTMIDIGLGYLGVSSIVLAYDI